MGKCAFCGHPCHEKSALYPGPKPRPSGTILVFTSPEEAERAAREERIRKLKAWAHG